MPIIYQKFIFREDLRNNRNVLYLFGDNDRREGFGGQAKEMRGEPNALGIRTKRAPDNELSSFYSDSTYDQNCRRIAEDFATAFIQIKQGKIVVIPADGLGTGLSRLEEMAPRTNAYLLSRLEKLKELAALLAGPLTTG